MLYSIFKWSFKFLYPIYFKEHIVIDKEKFGIKGPLILVSNHPNTLTDVVGVAKEVNQPVYFLANIGLFGTKFSNWFFSMFAIPIERTTDTVDGKIDNSKSFDKSHQHLNNGGVIYIAAEGYSTMIRVKHDFKTGTARIALGASKDTEWKNCTKILPISVIYDKPNFFRSRMLIVPSDPINCLDYKDKYLKDPQKTVKELTSEVQKKVYENSIYFESEEQLTQFQKWEQVYRAEYQKPFDIETKDLIKIRNVINDKTISKEALHSIDTIWSKLGQKNISYKDLSLSQSKTKSIIYYILMLPIFLCGSALNFFPSFVTIFIVRKLKLYVGYNTTAKMVLAWILFPMFYIGQFFLLKSYIIDPYDLLLLIIPLPLLIMSWHYYKHMSDSYSKHKIRKQLNIDSAFRSELLELRMDVTSHLEKTISTI